MGVVRLLAACCLCLAEGGQAADERLPRILTRLAEEAQIFLAAAPDMVAEEKLRQRGLAESRWFRPRIGQAAVEPPKPEYRTREIVSEYTYGFLKESPGVLHEFRQVVSVDGRPVQSREKARRTLAAGLRSEDDHARKRMLEEFASHGLRGAATDFGQLILLFTSRRLPDYDFTAAGEGRIGADTAVIVEFRQTAGEQALTIFDRRKAIRRPVEGQIWVRPPDWLPLRIVLKSAGMEEDREVLDQATVDYLMTPHGVIAPVSVVRRRLAGDQLIVEDVFEYSQFRRFGADAEVKFH